MAPAVRGPDFKSGDLESCSYQELDLFQVVSGSTHRLQYYCTKPTGLPPACYVSFIDPQKPQKKNYIKKLWDNKVPTGALLLVLANYF